MQEVSIPTPIRECIEIFKSKNEELSRPEVARGRCYRASRAFRDLLKSLGIESKLVPLEGLKDTPINCTAYPDDLDWDTFGHFVVVVDGLWIDWTARQMEAECAFPYVALPINEVGKWNRVMCITGEHEYNLNQDKLIRIPRHGYFVDPTDH